MISRRILAAVALLYLAVMPVHAQKTKAQLSTEITTTYPDNTSGQITPAGIRSYESDVINSIMPTAPVAPGNLACFDGTTGLLQDCGSAPSTVPLTVGTTPIGNSVTTSVMADIGGKLGEYSISGTGTVCMTVSCVMTTPNLGVPSAVTLTNATGLPISTGVTGLGTGISSALGINVGTAGALVLLNGAGGTPSSITLTNATGYPNATNALKGVMEGDGATINCTAGVCSSIGGTATAITIGTTNVISGTSHGILTDNAGTIGNTSSGSVGQALVSNGSSEPTFKSGAWVLLNTLTAAGSATLSDTTSISSAYTEYEVVLENILPATNNVTIEFQQQLGGSFLATSYLTTNLFGNQGTPVSQTITTGILASNTASVTNTGIGVSGRYLLSAPLASSICHLVHGEFTSFNGTILITGTSTGCFDNGSSSTVTGIQVLATSGNLASGVMKIYGRVN